MENYSKNHRINTAAVEGLHKDLISQNYVYIGTTRQSAWGDDVIITHRYLTPDQKSIRTIAYSAYAFGWDEFKYTTDKQEPIGEFKI